MSTRKTKATSADATQAAQAEPTPADANQVAAAVADIAVTEPAAAPQAVTPPPPMTFTIRCARRIGIWRAGRFWAAEPTTVSPEDFTDEQLAQIAAEPLLIATEEPGHE